MFKSFCSHDGSFTCGVIAPPPAWISLWGVSKNKEAILDFPGATFLFLIVLQDVCVCVCVCAHTSVNTWLWLCVCGCVFVYVSVCTSICIYCWGWVTNMCIMCVWLCRSLWVCMCRRLYLYAIYIEKKRVGDKMGWSWQAVPGTFCTSLLGQPSHPSNYLFP